jgi:hypothetical protein
MDNKKIMDIVEPHMLNQASRSVSYISGNEKCAYRGDDGMKCAVGVLIDDAHYSESFDMGGFPVWDESVAMAVEASLGEKLDALNMTFLSELQKIHDVQPVSAWPRCLAALRKSHCGG